MKFALERVIAAVLFTGFTLLLVLSLMASRELRSSNEESGLADSARTRLVDLQAVNRALLTAESGQRGFLLTSKVSYLDTYFKGVAATQNGLQQVAQDMSGNPAQQPQVERLLSLASAKLAELQQTVNLEQANRRSAALAIVQSDAGKQAMEQIQQITGVLIAGEREQLNRKRAATQSARLSTERLFKFAELGLALFFVGAFLFIRRTLRAQAAAEKTLAENEHLLRTVTDNLPVLISYTDINEIVRFGNSTYRKWLNVDPIAAVGRPLIDMIGAKVYEERREQIRLAFEGHSVEFQAVSYDQDRARHVQIVYLPDKRADGSVSGVFALTTDITAMKTIERQLEELARFDPLTGLPNRRQLEERLTEQRLFISREPQPYALVFLDIDHFKAINDTYGHGVGDSVLKQFASRLQASVRRTDVVARLAGDEFVILLKGLHRQQEANMIAEKILLTIGAKFEIENHVLSVTASIGIAFVTQGGTTEQALLACADKALYMAKNAGRNCFRQLDCNVHNMTEHRKTRA